MNVEDLIGKKEKVKIIGKTKSRKYYVGKSLENSYNIYIEDLGDYSDDELIGKEEECLIINIIKNNLIGFILEDRKFINDIKKIKNILKNNNEYEKVEDIYLMERLKIKGKVVGLYLVDEAEKRKVLFRYIRNRNIK